MKTEALKEAIKTSGLKTSFIVSVLGISRSAFYRKVNGSVEFTVSEMGSLTRTLGLKDDAVRDIFFTEKVS